MRILVCGSGPLGSRLVEALSRTHEVRTATVSSSEDHGSSIHIGDPRYRDFAARGTYNLAQSIPPGCRFVLVNSLRILERYPIRYRVSEFWAPHPSTDVEDLVSYLAGLPWPVGYSQEFFLADDAPPRAGNGLYCITKFLGQELCRIFAEEHDMQVPTLLFAGLHNPQDPPYGGIGLTGFHLSWQDAATAIRQALHVPTLPRSYEVFHIVADLPHRKYLNDKAKRMLSWQPCDTFERHLLRDVRE